MNTEGQILHDTTYMNKIVKLIEIVKWWLPGVRRRGKRKGYLPKNEKFQSCR